jgi:hypothetical protein
MGVQEFQDEIKMKLIYCVQSKINLHKLEKKAINANLNQNGA